VQSVTPTFWPAVPQWQNYADVFRLLPFFHQLQVSVLMTIIQTGVQIVLCTFAGYAFARMRFHGRALLFGVVLSILLVPPQVYLLSQYQIVQSLGWLNTVAGIVAPGLFSAFGTFLMRTAFRNLPIELEEAARLDGAGTFRTFSRVMLPLVGPSVSVLAITTVLFSWNLWLWPLVVSTRADHMPLSAGLATLSGNQQINYPVLMAASLLAMAPVLILFIVLQRRVIDGLASTGMKG
jgi:multiple sugar transport system permease protein